MIKKVSVDQLRPGIFVHDFNCPMTGENVFINETLIKTEKAIEILRSWGIKEVFIDTARGVDVSYGGDSQPAVRKSIDNGLHKLAEAKPATQQKVPLKKELNLAKIIKQEAVSVLQRAMDSVRKGNPLETEQAFNLVEKMEKSVSRNQDALILLTRIRKKDEYTLMHSISVSSLVLAFCNFNKIPHDQAMHLAVSALLHDIGKTKIPLSILNKPGKLTAKEFDIMKRHVEYSASIMEGARELPAEAYDIAMHHHERYDGTGYPFGLKGSEISYGSQVTAVCDVFDAITSVRCYKDGLDSVNGLRKLYEQSGHHFNKELTFSFIRCIGVYPIGSYVKLENDLIGVVVGSTENILQPIVRIFFNDQKQSAVRVEDIDLSRAGVNIANYESPDKWGIIDQKKIFTEIAGETALFC